MTRNTTQPAVYTCPTTGGAQFAIADGSVRFMSESIDMMSFVNSVTRAGGEVKIFEQ